ncbi:MAG: GGDEF domain-containing protein, partial [Candidatus Dadabacteria bacterium]|nr:GGDEF domain-containing protein [Candidatus Dadabacteria bacterium]
PLISQTTTLGIFFLSAYSDSVNYLSDKALKNKAKLARTVAEYASLALRNIKLQENLRQKSIRDPLTGLYNRGYLKETLEREVLQASRRNDSLGVILLDVDHFKRFNDTFGHDAGDAVLTAVSRLLQKNVRGGDIACRYGGEEFLILMPGISADDAMERAEKVRLEAGRLHVTHAGRTLDAVTVSLGISVHPDTCQTA